MTTERRSIRRLFSSRPSQASGPGRLTSFGKTPISIPSWLSPAYIVAWLMVDGRVASS